MGWIIVLVGVTALTAIEARRRFRRRAIRAVAVPVGAAASKPRSWWPAITVTQILGVLACWIIWHDMVRNEPLWLSGLDSVLAFVGFGVIAGKVAPSHGQGRGGVVWALSVGVWMLLMAGMAITTEGPAVLEDFDLIASGVWEWARGLVA